MLKFCSFTARAAELHGEWFSGCNSGAPGARGWPRASRAGGSRLGSWEAARLTSSTCIAAWSTRRWILLFKAYISPKKYPSYVLLPNHTKWLSLPNDWTLLVRLKNEKECCSTLPPLAFECVELETLIYKSIHWIQHGEKNLNAVIVVGDR